jgi:hypothetical protein
MRTSLPSGFLGPCDIRHCNGSHGVVDCMPSYNLVSKSLIARSGMDGASCASMVYDVTASHISMVAM